MDEKALLRDQLFSKYFEVKDGISAKDLVQATSFITEKWQELHRILEQHLEDFDVYSFFRNIVEFVYQDVNYLVIEVDVCDYLVIDFRKKRSLKKDELSDVSWRKFFLQYFGKGKGAGIEFFDMIQISEYEGDMMDLMHFYQENRNILLLPTAIRYRLDIGESWTYLVIDIVNDEAQLGFQTPDQFLYEQLFLRGDLTPSRMQDAVCKIGADRMKEMFQKIPDIVIPFSVIPEAFYQQGILQKKDYPVSFQLKKTRN